MSEHEKLEQLLYLYIVKAHQDMEDKDLFETESNSSDENTK